MAIVLVHTDRFAEHQTPPGHPERPERAEVMDVVAGACRTRGLEVVAPRAATFEQLVRVHAPEYLRLISETAGRAVKLDSDTYTSPESHEIALIAAGAAIQAVDCALGGSHSAAMAMVRPPGHHAERDRAMGFCLYNNVAVAAAHARARGTGKVAIVDYDVHHGNGTQHIFETDPNVLYLSLHQFPYYPGTGAATEVGRGAGCGFTVNCPLDAGAVDDDYRAVFDGIVIPVLRQFGPDLMMVSAGFDAHERDPLGGMRLTTAAFAAMTQELRLVADQYCEGRVALVTEGGYDLQAFAACLDQVIRTVDAPAASPAWPSSGLDSTRGADAVEEVRRTLSSFWAL